MNWAPSILPRSPTLCTVSDLTHLQLILKHSKTNIQLEHEFNNGTKSLMSSRITEVCFPKDLRNGMAWICICRHLSILKLHMKKKLSSLHSSTLQVVFYFLLFSISSQLSFNKYLMAVEKKKSMKSKASGLDSSHPTLNI